MNKRIIFLTGLVIILVSFTGFMVYKIAKTRKHNASVAATKQTLPNFTFYNLDSANTSNKFVTKGKPVCIIYFNADCEYCQYEAKEIEENITLFKNTQIVMVSFNTIKEIKEFQKKYHLNYSNITFLQDPKHEFKQWFGKTNIPAVFIYNAKHQLVKEYHGETKIEAITKYL
ncbi:MAG: redoxin domain-containing protein [Pedobacter sp.]|nr:MAG: redoxin domain-containing protein [Pedobacter sp.]